MGLLESNYPHCTRVQAKQDQRASLAEAGVTNEHQLALLVCPNAKSRFPHFIEGKALHGEEEVALP